MIKAVTVTNHNSESIRLELTRPELSGLAIRSIDGLGPPNATIFNNTLTTKDGSFYSGARCENRQITLQLIMWETDKLSIEDCRLLTYRYFPIKREVTLRFETDNRTLEIKGYVESNEPSIFSQQEEATISILCTDPWFYDAGQQEEFFTGVTSFFEFPFSNECRYAGDEPPLIPYNENQLTDWDLRPASTEFERWDYTTHIWGKWESREEDIAHISIFPAERGLRFQNNDLEVVSYFRYKLDGGEITKLNALCDGEKQFCISALYTEGLLTSKALTIGPEEYGSFESDPDPKFKFYLSLDRVGAEECYVSLIFNPASWSEVVGIKLEEGTESTLAHKEGDNWVVTNPGAVDPSASGWQVENTIEFSTRSLSTSVDFECVGDIDVGVVIRIDFVGQVGTIRVINRGTNETMTIYTDKIQTIIGSAIGNGDYVLISTKPGEKYARYYRSGLFYRNVIGAIDKNSDWFKITIGLNRLAYTATSGEENIHITFSYQNAYGGI